MLRKISRLRSLSSLIGSCWFGFISSYDLVPDPVGRGRTAAGPACANVGTRSGSVNSAPDDGGASPGGGGRFDASAVRRWTARARGTSFSPLSALAKDF